VFNIKAMIVPIVAIGTLIWVGSPSGVQAQRQWLTPRLSRLPAQRRARFSVPVVTACPAALPASSPS
jgi:hypothetical protein